VLFYVSYFSFIFFFFFFFQAEDGIRDYKVTGVQTCALPICLFTRAKTGDGDAPRRPWGSWLTPRAPAIGTRVTPQPYDADSGCPPPAANGACFKRGGAPTRKARTPRRQPRGG